MIEQFIERVQSAWCAETSYWPKTWSEEKPSSGQCAVTAEAFRRQFGGKIAKGEIDGVSHYWNVLGGTHIDITRDQFPVDATTKLLSVVPKVRGGADFEKRINLLLARLN